MGNRFLTVDYDTPCLAIREKLLSEKAIPSAEKQALGTADVSF